MNDYTRSVIKSRIEVLDADIKAAFAQLSDLDATRIDLERRVEDTTQLRQELLDDLENN